MIELGSGLRTIEHPPRQQRHGKAKLFEKPPEQTVELIAESASPAANDLVVERLDGKANGMAQMDVEILERDGQQVRAMELPERFGTRLARPLVLDAIEICLYLHDRSRLLPFGHPEPYLSHDRT